MSYESRTVADQRPALAVLAQVGQTFGHLPAPEFNASRVYPDRLTIGLHDDLSDFEAWREALEIPATAVDYKPLPSAASLTATVSWGGGTIELVGYGPLPLRDVPRDGAA